MVGFAHETGGIAESAVDCRILPFQDRKARHDAPIEESRLTVAAILRCVVRSRWRSDCEIFYWRLIDFAELAQPGESRLHQFGSRGLAHDLLQPSANSQLHSMTPPALGESLEKLSSSFIGRMHAIKLTIAYAIAHETILTNIWYSW